MKKRRFGSVEATLFPNSNGGIVPVSDEGDSTEVALVLRKHGETRWNKHAFDEKIVCLKGHARVEWRTKSGLVRRSDLHAGDQVTIEAGQERRLVILGPYVGVHFVIKGSGVSREEEE